MVALLADPMTAPVPSSLLPWQARAIAHSGELAISRGLQLVGRGTCRVPGHAGADVFAVASATRANLAHLVWIERGRIHCTCEARTLRHTLTCSHAQFVRLLIVAEHAAKFVAPAEPSAPVAPDSEPDPDPTPEPSGPRGPRCPSCAGPIDATELDELGECLNCLQMRADYERAEREEFHRFAAAEASLPCWACGATPASEERGGIYCEKCLRLPEKERKARARQRQKELTRQRRAERTEREYQKNYAARNVGTPATAQAPELPPLASKVAWQEKRDKEMTAARIIDRAKANAGTPSEASPRRRKAQSAER